MPQTLSVKTTQKRALVAAAFLPRIERKLDRSITAEVVEIG